MSRLAQYLSKLDITDEPEILPELLSNPLNVDLRIVISWDTDRTDIELHMIEPTGDKCYSFNNHTLNGGLLSQDVTQGYGPEEYIIKTAIHGEYQVFVRLFSPIATGSSDAITVKANIWTNFGRQDKEKETVVVVRVPYSSHKKLLHLATVCFQ